MMTVFAFQEQHHLLSLLVQSDLPCEEFFSEAKKSSLLSCLDFVDLACRVAVDMETQSTERTGKVYLAETRHGICSKGEPRTAQATN